jgi:hypothetical protein
MTRAAAIAVAGSALALTLSLALAHPDTPRPEGVAASAWIPVSADAGFVVTRNDSRVTSSAAGPSVRGYLMARRDGKWVRLELEGGGRLVPTD